MYTYHSQKAMKLIYKIIHRVEIFSNILWYCFREENKKKLTSTHFDWKTNKPQVSDWRYNKHSLLLLWSSRCSELSWAFLYITSLVESQQMCSCPQAKRISSGSLCQPSSKGEGSSWRRGLAVWDEPWPSYPKPTYPLSELLALFLGPTAWVY